MGFDLGSIFSGAASGASMGPFGAIAGGLLGGLMGGKKGSNDNTQTTQNQIDPRIVPYLYGADGKGGLLGQVSALQQQQSQNGGLNPMQTAGLEMQRQAYMDPRYTAGFDQMRSLGGSMMGQGVAGNPFAGGGSTMPMGNWARPSAPQQNLGLTPPAAAMQPIGAQHQPAPVQQIPQQPSPMQSQAVVQKQIEDFVKQQQWRQLMDINEAGMPNSTGA